MTVVTYHSNQNLMSLCLDGLTTAWIGTMEQNGQQENKIREELILPKLKIKDGYIEVPSKPGLGIDINEEKMDSFKI